MRRRRYRKPALNVSLFPFLAVLVCTMGSLIVLLVLVVQQARVYATGRSEQDDQRQQAADAQKEELRLEQEDFRWRGEILQQQRSELTNQLADSRLKLGHFEEHIRQLQRTWAQLQDQANRLEQQGTASQQDAAQTQAELDRVRQAVQAARDELARAQQEAANRPRSFAIVPYGGPHGTRRRPIYIECTETGIVLQPEGIRLTSQDFEGPSGPGNPLDAALRAVREHLAHTGRIEEDGEPYPLLIVRPQGTVAYLVAREAMKSWDDEFGYELVDGEMKLKYPAADPILKEKLARTVKDARQRQEILAAAMPSRFKNRPDGFVAAPHRGGFEPVNQGAGLRKPRSRGAAAGTGTDLSQADPDESSTGSFDRGSKQQNRKLGENAQSKDGAKSPGGPNRQPSEAGGGASFSLAQSRGANWALRNASDQATGITRPIRVACLPDRLMILPQRGEQQRSRVVDVPGRLNDAIDEFVTAIWQHTEQWGIAVVGGYWKPVLTIEVAPGAEQRFAELKSLLVDSGVEARRTLP